MNSKTPYENLNPDSILNAIESAGIPCSGSLTALNSFENRVYQIGVEDSAPIVAKFYRPGRWSDEAILEEHQFSLELAEHDIPVITPLKNTSGATLFHYDGFRFALFPRQGGRAFELDNLEHLEWMGRLIGRLHAVGAVRNFEHRITLNIENYGNAPYQFLLANNFIPDDVKYNYCLTVTEILKQITDIYAAIGSIKHIRLHGDCHSGNILWKCEQLYLVDLDDCVMGPAIQDIWMLLSGNRVETKLQLDYIMQGYEEFFDFDYRELHLIEVLRTLRMIHYTGWLAKRWDDPAFPLNFPWFNTPKYWNDQLQHLREQSYLLDELQESMS